MCKYRLKRANLKLKLPLFYAILITLNQKQEKKRTCDETGASVIQTNETIQLVQHEADGCHSVKKIIYISQKKKKSHFI